MALKAIINSLDEVDEALQSLYREEGGKFVLDIGDGVEDHPSVAALKRARDHEKKAAADAKKRVADLEAEFKKYEDVDPERAREALKKIEELEEKQMLEAGDVDKIVAQRTERMQRDYESKIAAKEKLIEELEGVKTTTSAKLADLMIYSEVERAALDAGARRGALDDIKNRAKSIFKMENDQVGAYKPGTDEPLYGKDSNPLTIGEWVSSLASEAEHLFEGNAGGSGSGSGGNSAAGRPTVVPRSQAGSNLEKIAAGESVIGD